MLILILQLINIYDLLQVFLILLISFFFLKRLVFFFITILLISYDL